MYQNYITGQTEFVLNYDYDVPENHLVRLISAFVDSIPAEVLLEDEVATTGRPLSHPALMLKILLFAYTHRAYSGRKIETMLEENLPMRWLAQDYRYSYHTINNFRRSRHTHNLIKRDFVYFTMALQNHGLLLMAMNLTKLGRILAHSGLIYLEKGKIRTTIFDSSKFVVRIFLFYGEKIKVISQPLFILITRASHYQPILLPLHFDNQRKKNCQ